jgi:hypothetical protein
MLESIKQKDAMKDNDSEGGSDSESSGDDYNAQCLDQFRKRIL